MHTNILFCKTFSYHFVHENVPIKYFKSTVNTCNMQSIYYAELKSTLVELTERLHTELWENHRGLGMQLHFLGL